MCTHTKTFKSWTTQDQLFNKATSSLSWHLNDLYFSTPWDHASIATRGTAFYKAPPPRSPTAHRGPINWLTGVTFKTRTRNPERKSDFQTGFFSILIHFCWDDELNRSLSSRSPFPPGYFNNGIIITPLILTNNICYLLNKSQWFLQETKPRLFRVSSKGHVFLQKHTPQLKTPKWKRRSFLNRTDGWLRTPLPPDPLIPGAALLWVFFL